MSDRTSSIDDLDMLIVGAGLSGMHMLHRARALGLRALVIEAGGDVGGSWYWARYPGLRCDVESMQYSYSFSDELQQEWEWRERYAPQPEIRRYLDWVADRLDLRRDIRFDTRIASAAWDEPARRWRLVAEDGATFSATWCVMATGGLSRTQLPDIPGVRDFAGEAYHTGEWPDGIDFAGKRVGVIGTGSSGIQIIPEIARTARSLHVFQRTAPYVLEALNRPLSDDDLARWKSDYPAIRQRARMQPAGILFEPIKGCSAFAVNDDERRAEFDRCWAQGGSLILATFNDVMVDRAANATISDYIRERIDEQVADPELRRKLRPAFPFGTKRPPIGRDYYATYNRPNVHLVDLRETPILRMTADGIETTDGPIALGMIVYATGYDAITGALAKIDITGRDGLTLAEKWADGPRHHLGILSHGFPNLFTLLGPLSPSIFSNVIVQSEQHVEWTADCISHLRGLGADRIEPELAAEDAWVEEVNAIAAMTLFPEVDSWYMGANVPGKPRVFPIYAGGVGTYRTRTAEIAAAGYPGFTIG